MGKKLMFLVVKKFYESIYLLAFVIDDIIVMFSFGHILRSHMFPHRSLLSSTSVLDDNT